MDQSKSITIITVNYYPEDSAIGLYTRQFAVYLMEKGYSVQVITGFPYYPQWKINENYLNKPTFYRETIDGISIYRFKQYLTEDITFYSRVLMMISHFFGTFCNLTKIKKTDLVFCIVPFTISIIPAWFLTKIKRAKLWIHIQDFEFDLAIQSGLVSKNNLWSTSVKNVCFALEKALFGSGDVVSSISQTMLDKIKIKSSQKNPYLFPNWVSHEKVNPQTSTTHSLINSNKFTFLYSGNIGEKQDWNVLFEVCKLIKTEDQIEVFIIGDGSYKTKLIQQLEAFDFIKIHDPVPYSQLNDLLCSADAHFLFQKTDLLDTMMPSKVLGMMASAKPSVISGNKISEVKKIITESKGGFYVSGKNLENKIYSSILEIKNNKNTSEMGLNARKYILDNFSEENILSNTEEKIKKLLS